jgi:hypothetical protein
MEYFPVPRLRLLGEQTHRLLRHTTALLLRQLINESDRKQWNLKFRACFNVVERTTDSKELFLF